MRRMPLLLPQAQGMQRPYDGPIAQLGNPQRKVGDTQAKKAAGQDSPLRGDQRTELDATKCVQQIHYSEID